MHDVIVRRRALDHATNGARGWSDEGTAWEVSLQRLAVWSNAGREPFDHEFRTDG
jgi:hypothetical protein